jgi:quinol monooxygenase YgiN
MIIVKATITSKSGEKNNIISKSRELIKSTRLEEGCISYDLYANIEDEDTLLMIEQWKNKEVLNTHMQTEHFKSFGMDIKDLLAKEIDITLYSADKL